MTDWTKTDRVEVPVREMHKDVTALKKENERHYNAISENNKMIAEKQLGIIWALHGVRVGSIVEIKDRKYNRGKGSMEDRLTKARVVVVYPSYQDRADIMVVNELKSGGFGNAHHRVYGNIDEKWKVIEFMSNISIIQWGRGPGEAVHLRPYPKRPFTAVKVFRDDHGSHYAINAKGEIFTTAARGTGIYCGVGRRQATILMALHRMGVFKDDSAKKVAELSRLTAAAESKAWAAARVEEEARDAGITLTDQQLRQIAKIKRKAK